MILTTLYHRAFGSVVKNRNPACQVWGSSPVMDVVGGIQSTLLGQPGSLTGLPALEIKQLILILKFLV